LSGGRTAERAAAATSVFKYSEMRGHKRKENLSRWGYNDLSWYMAAAGLTLAQVGLPLAAT